MAVRGEWAGRGERRGGRGGERGRRGGPPPGPCAPPASEAAGPGQTADADEDAEGERSEWREENESAERCGGAEEEAEGEVLLSAGERGGDRGPTLLLVLLLLLSLHVLWIWCWG